VVVQSFPLFDQLIYLYQPSFDAAPPQPPPVATVGMDYESLTLLRMREAERARLEKEILEAEDAEGS
jgi:DnaJ family protein C protein 17